jgi:hypothetical protein
LLLCCFALFAFLCCLLQSCSRSISRVLGPPPWTSLFYITVDFLATTPKNCCLWPHLTTFFILLIALHGTNRSWQTKNLLLNKKKKKKKLRPP